MTDSKLTAVIVDDEPIARKRLNRLLADIDRVLVVGEAATGRQALELIDRTQPDIAFLDIQMPELDGVTVARQLPGKTRVVFTTAHAEHAITAFELSAVDYLLKPFGAKRLAGAIERVTELQRSGDYPAMVGQALGSGSPGRLYVRSGSHITPVEMSDILYCAARRDYVQIVTRSRKHILHVTMRALEQQLDNNIFRRVHRSHIVNMMHVDHFEPASSGRFSAVMTNGSRVPVSRSKSRELRKQGI